MLRKASSTSPVSDWGFSFETTLGDEHAAKVRGLVIACHARICLRPGGGASAIGAGDAHRWRGPHGHAEAAGGTPRLAGAIQHRGAVRGGGRGAAGRARLV